MSLRYSTGFHHRPLEVPVEHRALPLIVHVADILAARAQLGYTRTLETEVIDPVVLTELNCSDWDAEAILAKLPAEMQGSMELLSDQG